MRETITVVIVKDGNGLRFAKAADPQSAEGLADEFRSARQPAAVVTFDAEFTVLPRAADHSSAH